jgi:hypothetical protein
LRSGGSVALDVEPQDVIPGQAESADGCFITDAGMRSVPICARYRIALKDLEYSGDIALKLMW